MSKKKKSVLTGQRQKSKNYTTSSAENLENYAPEDLDEAKTPKNSDAIVAQNETMESAQNDLLNAVINQVSDTTVCETMNNEAAPLDEETWESISQEELSVPEAILDSFKIEAAIEQDVPKSQTLKKKANKKNEEEQSVTTIQRIKLCDTSYHYYRNFLKELLRGNSPAVNSARFVKNEKGWNGQITILPIEKEIAESAFEEYRRENPEVKDLWW